MHESWRNHRKDLSTNWNVLDGSPLEGEEPIGTTLEPWSGNFLEEVRNVSLGVYLEFMHEGEAVSLAATTPGR